MLRMCSILAALVLVALLCNPIVTACERDDGELTYLITSALDANEMYPDSLVAMVAETAIEYGRTKDSLALIKNLKDSDLQERSVRRICVWLAAQPNPQALRLFMTSLEEPVHVDVARAALAQSMAVEASELTVLSELRQIRDKHMRSDAALMAAEVARKNGQPARSSAYVAYAHALVSAIAADESRSGGSISTTTGYLLADLAVGLYLVNDKDQALRMIHELEWSRCSAIERIAKADAWQGEWELALNRVELNSSCPLVDSAIVHGLLDAGRVSEAEKCARRLGSAGLLRKVDRQRARQLRGPTLLELVQQYEAKPDFAALLLAEAAQRAIDRSETDEATDLARLAKEVLEVHSLKAPFASGLENEARCLIAKVLKVTGLDQEIEEFLGSGAVRAAAIPLSSDPTPAPFQGAERVLQLLRIGETAFDCRIPRIGASSFRAAWEECNGRSVLQWYCAAAIGRSGDVQLVHTLLEDLPNDELRGALLHVAYFEASEFAEPDEQVITSSLMRAYASLGVIRGANSSGALIIDGDLRLSAE